MKSEFCNCSKNDLINKINKLQAENTRLKNIQIEYEKIKADLTEINNILETQFINSPDLILIIDRNYKIITINRILTGKHSIDELIGRDSISVLPRSCQDQIQQNVDQCFETGIKFIFEHIISEKKVVLARLIPIIKNNAVEKVMIISTDITERKKIQEQLIHSEKLSAVGQITAGIAHDFNNILGICQMNIELLELNEKQISNESLEILQTINNTIKRGTEVVSNIMSFSQPNIPKKELCKIENIIEDVLRLQKQQFILENIEISTSYKITSKIFIDGGQFQQVFLNMIINARHAIAPKGKGKISILVESLKKYIKIIISDDGVGIDKENIQNIFNPFFTTKGIDSHNDYKIKGTGLGLAVSYNIIKNHKGSIKVKSENHKGTTFTIEIPILKVLE